MKRLMTAGMLAAVMLLGSCGSEETAQGPTTSRQRMVLLDVQPTATDAMWQRAIRTHAQQVAITDVLQAVVDDRDVQRTGWYKALAGKEPWSTLAQHVHVSVVEGTSLIEVWVDGLGSMDSVVLTNTVGKEYLEFLRRRQNMAYEETRRVLEKRFDNCKASITALIADYEQHASLPNANAISLGHFNMQLESLERMHEEALDDISDLAIRQADRAFMPVRVVQWAVE